MRRCLAVTSLLALSVATLITAAGSGRAIPLKGEGGRIVFWSARDGSPQIYVMNADGTGARNLTRNAQVAAKRASWSPDGGSIAFDRHTGGADFDIYVMRADGSGQRRLTRSGARETLPAWSPDGGRIAYCRTRSGASGGEDVWTDPPRRHRCAAPDGQRRGERAGVVSGQPQDRLCSASQRADRPLRHELERRARA
jgi:dipeptidyl aminopeptidase/acylaminoacyl peptidase